MNARTPEARKQSKQDRQRNALAMIDQKLSACAAEKRQAVLELHAERKKTAALEARIEGLELDLLRARAGSVAGLQHQRLGGMGAR